MNHYFRKILFTAFSLTLTMSMMPSCAPAKLDKEAFFETVPDTDYSITYYWARPLQNLQKT